MVKRLLTLGLLFIFCAQAHAVPDNTMSITPAATSGTTITAADENDRNSDVSTTYNAHSHTDITAMSGVNTFTIGDGAAGAKTYAVNDAQASDPALRYSNAVGYWTISTDGSTFDAIGLSSGVVITGENDFRIGDNLGTANKRLIANEDATDGVIRWLSASDRWELSNDASNFAAIQTVSGNTIVAGINETQVGDGTTTANKYIYANTTSTIQDPNIRYNTVSSVWQFSNNGTSWTNFGGGSSGETVDAWVKFDGSGTVTINDHVNCSSITDNATGDFTVNWSITQPNSTWMFQGTASGPNPSGVTIQQATQTATAIRISVKVLATGADNDSDEIHCMAIGDYSA